MKRVLMGFLVTWCLAEPATASPLGFQLPERPHFTDVAALEAYRVALYHEHVRCGELAAETFLGWDEVNTCSEIYLRLKLSFLNGVTLDRYRTMPVKTKVVTHDKGYSAYLAWLHRQNLEARID